MMGSCLITEAMRVMEREGTWYRERRRFVLKMQAFVFVRFATASH